MTIDNAVKKFANDFSFIPTQLILETYKNRLEDLICLNSEDFKDEDFYYYWPAMWGTMFCPNDWTDKEWIKENTSKVEECGFIIYECDYCDILLGINGAGYDFYESHWKPLYFARGLKWHKSNDVA